MVLQTQGVYLHQFVLHAALDAVNEQLWTTSNMHLGAVDKFNNLTVTAYTTAAHIKFLLLHDGRSDDTIRLFFRDVYEIYIRVGLWWQRYADHASQSLLVKPADQGTNGCLLLLQVVMNPFFTTVGRISSPAFSQKVRILAKTHFRT